MTYIKLVLGSSPSLRTFFISASLLTSKAIFSVHDEAEW